MRKRSRTATSPAPTSPVIWVFAPDWSATAVREPLTETAKPWKSPAAMFEVPMPTISWSGLTSSPRLAAKLVAVAMVSVSDTMRDAHGAEKERADVGPLGPRQARNGESLGKRADGLHAVGGQVEYCRDDRHADDGHQDGRHPIGEPRQDEQYGQDAEAGQQRRPVGLVEPVEEGAHLADEVVGAGGESEELGQLPDDDGDGQAVEVAHADLTGEEVGDETEFGHPQPDLDEPDQYRQHAGECDRTGGVAGDDEGRDRDQDQWRDRRVGPEHQHLRRSEHRVGDETCDRRVQTCHRRKPRQLRIGHALGDQDGRQDHPRHQIRSKPPSFVVS